MANFFFSEAPLEISHIIIKMYAEKFSFYSLVTKGGSVKESLEFLQNRLVSKLFRDVIDEWFIENWGVKRWNLETHSLCDFDTFGYYIYCLDTWNKYGDFEISFRNNAFESCGQSIFFDLKAPECKDGIITCVGEQRFYGPEWPNEGFDILSLLYLKIDCQRKEIFISCCKDSKCPTNQDFEIRHSLFLDNYTLINTGKEICKKCSKIESLLDDEKTTEYVMLNYGNSNKISKHHY